MKGDFGVDFGKLSTYIVPTENQPMNTDLLTEDRSIFRTPGRTAQKVPGR